MFCHMFICQIGQSDRQASCHHVMDADNGGKLKVSVGRM